MSKTQDTKAAKPAEQTAAEREVTILSPVQHDGDRLEPGAVVVLPLGATDALIACGAASPVERASGTAAV
jgi:hypothetical protein